jgi:hypothetical protein
MVSFPCSNFAHDKNENPGQTAPLNQIEPMNQRLRLEKVNEDAPRQITPQKDAKTRSLRELRSLTQDDSQQNQK